jgi:acyl-CoA synthetase (AMP-forming)/AMP-acid ligase II
MRIYKTGTIEIPQDLNLTELLHTTAYDNIPPSHLVAKDSLTNRSITLGELRRRAGRLAQGLVDAFHPKDQSRWAILLPNSVDYLETFHAILWTGGKTNPGKLPKRINVLIILP